MVINDYHAVAYMHNNVKWHLLWKRYAILFTDELSLPVSTYFMAGLELKLTMHEYWKTSATTHRVLRLATTSFQSCLLGLM